MNIHRFAMPGLLVMSLLGSGVVAAQAPAPPPGAPPFDRAAMEAEVAAYNKLPDTAGTGKYPSFKETTPSLPNHVIYRPADLSKLGTMKLGVVAWGNGGCSNDGAGGRFHLAEIASHGYLAIANGKILSGPGAPPASATPPPAAPAGTFPPPLTVAKDLSDAIDWALAENMRKGSPYFGRIDPKQIAVSGWSCGGIQALAIAPDPRVRAVVIHNSGIP
jgi:hypothetical protein